MRFFEAMERRDMMSSTPGQTMATRAVRPIDDTIVESTETVVMPVQSRTNYLVGTNNQARIGSDVQIDGPFVAGKDQDAAELVIQKILTRIR